jgi:hypothetical protein
MEREQRDELLALAERQHGLISSDQLIDLQLSWYDIKHLTGVGTLVRLSPRVLRVHGAPVTEAQQLMRAVLDAGPRAALANSTALAHWGVRGFQHRPIHVVRHRDEGDRPPRGVIVHEVRDLPDREIRVLEGIPVVSPALALLQFAGLRRTSHERLGTAVDNAWTDRLVSYRTLDGILERMSQRGRPGLQKLRDIVQERGPAYVPPASGLEGRVRQILRNAGLPEMRRQVDTGDDESWIGRVDVRADDCPFILEIQSERFHSGLTATRADEARFARLRAAGFVVDQVTDIQVFHTPWEVVDTVRAGRAAALRRHAA